MAASYPGTIRVFVPKRNLLDTVEAQHPNALQEEMEAVQTNLGVNPHISTAGAGGMLASGGMFSAWTSASREYATISDRMASLELADLSDTHTHYVRFENAEFIQGYKTFRPGVKLGDSAAGRNADLTLAGGVSGGGRAFIDFQTDGSSRWTVAKTQGTATLVVRDTLNSRDQLTFTPGTSNLTATSAFASNLTVAGNTTNTGTLTQTGTSTFTGAATFASNVSVAGVLLTTATGIADLSASSGLTSGATGTGSGDKLALHLNYGFGIQSSRLVAYMTSTAAFAVRAQSATGNKSSGATDAHTFFADGTATHAGALAVTTGDIVASNGAVAARNPAVDRGNAFIIPGQAAAQNGGFVSVQPNGTLAGYVGFGNNDTQTTLYGGTLKYVAATHAFTGALTVGAFATTLGGNLSVAGTTELTGALTSNGATPSFNVGASGSLQIRATSAISAADTSFLVVQGRGVFGYEGATTRAVVAASTGTSGLSFRTGGLTAAEDRLEITNTSAAFKVPLTASTGLTVTAGNIRASSGFLEARNSTANTGWTQVLHGDSNDAGYIGFMQPNSVRAGYIGRGAGTQGSTDAGTINYVAGQHAFTGTIYSAVQYGTQSHATVWHVAGPIAAGVGNARLVAGDATFSGYLDLYAPNGSLTGRIGASTNSAPLEYDGTNGHYFTGDITAGNNLQVNGTLNVTGGINDASGGVSAEDAYVLAMMATSA